MASRNEWSCPICCDDQEEVTCLLPCLHQVCLGCALRWVEQKPNCPLCRTETTTILFSVWSDDDYLTFDVPGPTKPLVDSYQAELGTAGPVPWSSVIDFPSEVWADFFKSNPINIRPLVPWVQRALQVLTDSDWWDLAVMEGKVVTCLCNYGLDEEVLVRELQSCIPADTETFVRQLMAVATHLCGSELRQHLAQHSFSPLWEDASPAASTSACKMGTPNSSLVSASSSADSDLKEEATRSEAALRGSPVCSHSAPIPVEQEQPQEEPGEMVAGPSVWGCSQM